MPSQLDSPAQADASAPATPSQAPVPPVSPAPSNYLIRQAFPDDHALLASALQARSPASALVQRGRAAMLERLLGRPELGLCLLVWRDATLLGCMPVALVPRLDLGGLAAMVGETWCLPEGHESGAILASCRDWLADWCRAHGVRHLLWAPELPGAGHAGAAWRRLPCGLWHHDVAPAPKLLG